MHGVRGLQVSNTYVQKHEKRKKKKEMKFIPNVLFILVLIYVEKKVLNVELILLVH